MVCAAQAGKMLRKLVQTAIVAGVCVAVVPARAIEVGDPAPPLKINKWIRGGPVDLHAGRGKNIYVIEFWATWCAPCRQSIPLLTELQRKFKDKGVVVIGITSEPSAEAVARFVSNMGDKMDYAVAQDDGQQTDAAYMRAFGLSGIPHTFVIDQQGRIAWHGHPLTGELERVVQELVDGKYDLEKARQQAVRLRQLEQARSRAMPLIGRYFQIVGTSRDRARAEAAAKEFMPVIANDPLLLYTVARTIVLSRDLMQRDLVLAEQAVRRAHELDTKNPAPPELLARILWETGRKEEAVQMQKKAVALADGDEGLKAELEKTLKRYEEELHK
jgi:thiol-disulfide isomerase/thioredoxin